MLLQTSKVWRANELTRPRVRRACSIVPADGDFDLSLAQWSRGMWQTVRNLSGPDSSPVLSKPHVCRDISLSLRDCLLAYTGRNCTSRHEWSPGQRVSHFLHFIYLLYIKYYESRVSSDGSRTFVMY